MANIFSIWKVTILEMRWALPKIPSGSRAERAWLRIKDETAVW